MPKETVVIMCDASGPVGYGHVRRCLVLSGIYRRLGLKVVFLMRKAVPAVVTLLAAHGAELVVRPGFGAFFSFVRENMDQICLVVIDHYEIGPDLEARIFGCVPVLVVDDLCRPHWCDLIVDQTLGREAGAYTETQLNAKASILTGIRYTMIDPVYRGVCSTMSPNNVLVSFGATDPKGVALRVLKMLDHAGRCPDLVFHLPLSSAAPCKDALERFIRRSGLDIRLYPDLPDLTALYTCCGIGLGAPGTSLLERIYCGLANLTLVVAGNQAEVGRQADLMGLAKDLGQLEFLDARELTRQLRRFTDGSGHADRVRQQADGLVDGRGAARVAGKSLALIAPVVLRPAAQADLAYLFRLQNEPLARQYFNHPGPVDEATHRAWFGSVLSDRQRQLFIIEWHGRPVGMIRLDRHRGKNEVSILVSRKFRGAGLGKRALKRLIPAGEGHCTAEIHPENRASICLFASAGFRKTGERRYDYHGTA